MFENVFEHFVKEFLALASNTGHVVKYASEVIAEPGGSEPSGDGSSSSDGEQSAEEKRQEERFYGRFEFAIESFGEGLENFEGVLLSLLIHGSSFSDRACLTQTILYTKSRLPVKTNFAKFLGKGSLKDFVGYLMMPKKKPGTIEKIVNTISNCSDTMRLSMQAV
jgi:hypothetical protein